MMLENDCPEIAVVDNVLDLKLIGIINEHDIVCQALAFGKNPLEMTAVECMRKASVTVSPDTEIEDCCNTLISNRIKRLPVVNERGSCCGTISSSDFSKLKGD